MRPKKTKLDIFLGRPEKSISNIAQQMSLIDGPQHHELSFFTLFFSINRLNNLDMFPLSGAQFECPQKSAVVSDAFNTMSKFPQKKILCQNGQRDRPIVTRQQCMPMDNISSPGWG
jgi:hypothetical protein